MAIDWRFISDLEGGQRLAGYVPDPTGSNSGVTAATGVDLGQMSSDDISTLDIPDTLKSKRSPTWSQGPGCTKLPVCKPSDHQSDRSRRPRPGSPGAARSPASVKL